jgi:Tfp pilus assembly protein PilF
MPKDAGVLVTLAKLELQEKHAAKAEEWVRRALKEAPTDTEAEFTLAAALQAQERWDEAKTVLEQHGRDTAMWKRIALMLQQDAERPNTDPAALSELGIIFLHSNEHVGLYWLHRALQRDPHHQPTHKALAEFFESKGDREKAAFHRLQLNPESKTPP